MTVPDVKPAEKKVVHLPENIKPRPLKADKRGRVRKIKNDPRYVKYF
jgi:hypothetical protein